MENTESAAKSLAVLSACVSQDEASLRLLMRDKSYWKVLNLLNIRGLAPVHVAVSSRNMNILKLLIEHGADLTLLDANGDTPLHRACRIGFFEAVEFLCSFREVGLESLNSHGQTPLEVALEARESNISYEDRYGTVAVDYNASSSAAGSGEAEIGRQRCVAFLDEKIRLGKNARENDYLLETIRVNQLKMKITEILRNTGPGRHKNYVARFVNPPFGDENGWTIRDYNTFYSNINSYNHMAASVAASGVLVTAMNNALYNIDLATTKRAEITRNKTLLEELDGKKPNSTTASLENKNDDIAEDENDITELHLRPLQLPPIDEIVEEELVFPMVWKGINVIIKEGTLGNFDISNRKARRIRTPKTTRERSQETTNASSRRRASSNTTDGRKERTPPATADAAVPVALVQNVILSGVDSVSIEDTLVKPQPFAAFCKDIVNGIMFSGVQAVASRDLSALTSAVGESTACSIIDDGLVAMKTENHDELKSTCSAVARSLMLSVFTDVYSKNTRLRGNFISMADQASVMKHATLFVEDIIERGLHSFSTDFAPSNRTLLDEGSTYLDAYVAKSVLHSVAVEVDDASSVHSMVGDFASTLMSQVTSQALHRLSQSSSSNTSVSGKSPSSALPDVKQGYIANYSKSLVEQIIRSGVSSVSSDQLEPSELAVDIVTQAIKKGLEAFNGGKNRDAYFTNIISTIEGTPAPANASKNAGNVSTSSARGTARPVQTVATDFIEDIIKCGLKSLVSSSSASVQVKSATPVPNAVNHMQDVAKNMISTIISEGLVSTSMMYSNISKAAALTRPSNRRDDLSDSTVMQSQTPSQSAPTTDFITGLISDVILQGIRQHAAGITVQRPVTRDNDSTSRDETFVTTSIKSPVASPRGKTPETSVVAPAPMPTSTDSAISTIGEEENNNSSRPESAADMHAGSTAFLTA